MAHSPRITRPEITESSESGMQRHRIRRTLLRATVLAVTMAAIPALAGAADDPAVAAHGAIFQKGQLNIRELLRAGGLIGYVTIFVSLGMVALIVEQVLTVRRGTLMPNGL